MAGAPAAESRAPEIRVDEAAHVDQPGGLPGWGREIAGIRPSSPSREGARAPAPPQRPASRDCTSRKRRSLCRRAPRPEVGAQLSRRETPGLAGGLTARAKKMKLAAPHEARRRKTRERPSGETAGLVSASTGGCGLVKLLLLPRFERDDEQRVRLALAPWSPSLSESGCRATTPGRRRHRKARPRNPGT